MGVIKCKNCGFDLGRGKKAFRYKYCPNCGELIVKGEKELMPRKRNKRKVKKRRGLIEKLKNVFGA